ncbi:MAG: circularly permuted type 2 ATP-grasp protein [Pseudonocardiales bacterium]|nr:circularly permuted type 2 ATP-grasp protein [Pseudonocardiales bacterium]
MTPAAGAPDEMLAPDGTVRPAWAGLAALLERSGPDALAARARSLVADDGVTYRPADAGDDLPWALDPLPLPVEAADWAVVEAGVAQRARLLDLLLADLYGPRRTLRTGLLPVEVVLGHPGFVRGWAREGGGPARRELFLAAADVVRTPDGWRVLGDRVQAPSGAGYALAGRRVVARVVGEVHRRTRIRRLGPFFDAVRRGLEELAPAGPDGPRVVLLSPGPRSETAYEQALLAARLGFPLVLGSELRVRDGRLWRRTLDPAGGPGREPVDVVLRRVDAAWCDPLDLRQGSQLGVPGLLEAARRGTVALANGLGSGVAENPGLLPFLPALCEALLDEPLALPGAPTWWCGDPVARAHVLDRLPELLLKPVARDAGRDTVDGAALDAAGRAELAARIAAEPHAWVGQEPQRVSTAPVATPGGLAHRPVVLRTFAVATGTGTTVLPGGLATAGGAAKDVWVLGAGPVAAPVPPLPVPDAAAIGPRVAADLFWLGRYAERAEGTARLLRAVTDRDADFRSSPEPAGREALEVLLRATAAVTATGPDVPLAALVADRDRPGTLAHAVHRLTGAAQAVREQMSTDTWLVLGRLDAELAGRGDLSRVLEGLLALAGLAAESLVRDAGWHLLDAGRRVERALHVAALLDATLVEPVGAGADALVRESVLITAESLVTHRRRQREGTDALLELLVTDPANPRSVAFQVARLRADLAGVPGAGADAELAAVEERLRQARPAALARRAPDGSRPALRALATGLLADLTRFAEVLERRRFAPDLPARPLDPTAAVGA